MIFAVGAHLRGRVRLSEGHTWTWEIYCVDDERVITEGIEFSHDSAMTECRKAVVAARTWWLWGGGADVSVLPMPTKSTTPGKGSI